MKNFTLLLLLCFSSSLLFAQNYKFGKVSKSELEENTYPLDSTANAAYLYKYKKIFYEYSGDDGWTIVTEVHERIKIYNKKGFDYATHQVSLYESGGVKEQFSSFKGYTYSLKNGKLSKEKLSKKNIFKEKNTKNWKIRKITFPNVGKGTVLEYKYRIVSPYYTFIDDIILQHKIPVKNVKVVVKIPEYLVFNRKIKGYLFVGVEQTRVNRTISYSYRVSSGIAKTSKEFKSQQLSDLIYTIDKKDIPALKIEPYVSNMNNYRSECKFELAMTRFPNSMVKPYSSTWKSVAKKIYESDAFGGELSKKAYYKNDITTVISGSASDQDKIKAVFQFVKTKVKWNGNYGKYTQKGVRKAYKDGVGNVAEINLMLTSMLRSVGVQANPVLISTRNNGVSFFPTLKGFNYVISAVVFPDKTYVLLDATELYSLPNVLPIRDLNWEGRVVKKDGDSYSISLTTKKHAVEDNNISVKISDEGLVAGMMRSKYTRHEALAYRKKYNHVKDDDVISQIEEKYEIEIDNFRISNKKKIGKPINQLLKFSSEDLIEEINGKNYISPLLFLTSGANPFKLEDRKFPVDFETPWKKVNRVTIKIPEGYKVESFPKSIAIGLPEKLGVFKYQVQVVNNVIKVISIMQLNNAIIAPQYYQHLKEFYKTMVEKQSEKIVFVKK